MSTLVVPAGPGSVYPIDDGWAAADVEMRYEDVAPEHGTDTIAVLELKGVFETYERGVLCELTFGDAAALKQRLEATIAKRNSRSWEIEHEETGGDHFGLTARGTSAYSLCPVCIEQRQ